MRYTIDIAVTYQGRNVNIFCGLKRCTLRKFCLWLFSVIVVDQMVMKPVCRPAEMKKYDFAAVSAL